MPTRFGGPGVANNLGVLASNLVALEAGQVWQPPANWYRAILGNYTTVQSYDFIGNLWRPVADPMGNAFIYCDGVNVRLANTSGCAVAALLTAAGSGYITPPVVTASVGNSTWTAVLGQVVSTIAITNGGTNYQYTPEVVIAAPPSPGVQATAFATITAGAVTGITIVDQGAGYTSPPTVTLINDPRDQTGANAIAVASLTGLGTVTAVLCNNHGQNTAGVVPTLTIAGGGGTGAAATALMNSAVTGYAVTTAGAGYTTAAGSVTISAANAGVAGASAYINPSSQLGFLRPRPARIIAPTSAAGGVLVGGTVLDGGAYASVPAATAITVSGGNGIPTTAAVVTLTTGGVTDTNYLNPQ